MLKQGVNSNGECMRDFYVEHDPVDIDCSHDGMTRQEFAAECDINVLLDRYEKTGVLNHFNTREPLYLDLSDGVPDLMQAMDVLHRASDAFMTLPAKVRREFDQDALKFVAFAENPDNLPQLREWGLAPPAVVAGGVSAPGPDPSPGPLPTPPAASSGS